MAGDVTGGVNPRVSRAAILVDDNTVVDFQAGGLGQLDIRDDTYPDNHQVRWQDFTRIQVNPGSAVVVHYLPDTGGGSECHSL